MRVLYGRYFEARYSAVASLVPEHSSVVEVCAGDCRLYRKYLSRKNVRYLALDMSASFVQAATRRGIPARVFDLRTETPPLADYVIIQASLYQFLPDPKPAVDRLLHAAQKKLIIAEPIRNLSDSSIPLVRWLSRRLTRPSPEDHAYCGERFNADTLTALFQQFESFERSFLIPGGRELVGVFKGGGAP